MRKANKTESNGNGNGAVPQPDISVAVAPKKRTVIRKLFMTAMRTDTPETEAVAAFHQLRKLMRKEVLDPTEILRPDWGGGPLVACLQKVGSVMMVTGRHKDKTLAHIVHEDPQWIMRIGSTGGLAPGPRHEALMAVHKAMMEEFICIQTGDWSDFDLDDWGNDLPEEEVAARRRAEEAAHQKQKEVYAQMKD
jgi:hypothetical protein